MIMSSTGTARFKYIDILGKGGMGDVYDAYDRDRGMRVALKKLRNVDAASVYRFKREFRALRGLSHPNIIALYELVAENEQWFLTMERVDGRDLIAYVQEFGSYNPTASGPTASHVQSFDSTATRTATSSGFDIDEHCDATGLPTPPQYRPHIDDVVDLDRLRDTLRQLAEALFVLHSAGMVHRDLKPSNVMVTREGRVVLMDFGIVTELLRPVDPVDGHKMVGTPSFMAPEQTHGHPATAAADWYAFGVLLYIALAKRLPFQGGVSQILRAKVELDPLSPAAFVDGIPDDLNDLCMYLLRRDPSERPDDRDVLAQLGANPERMAFSSGATFHGADIFVGRTEELRVLHEAYKQVQSGGTRCICVRAPSGMGKSSLLDRFAEELAEPEWHQLPPLVLEARCQETENLSYKAFDGVMDALCNHILSLADDERDAFVPQSSHALSKIFPVLRRIPGWETDGPLAHLNPNELRGQAVYAMRSLLACVVHTRPVVMRIDDIHWADRDSVELLLGILAPPTPERLLLVSSLRSDAHDESIERALIDMLATLEQRGVGQTIELGPLFGNEQRALIKALALQRGLFEDLDEQLWFESEGHPMLLAELVWYAMEAPQELAGAAANLSLEGVMNRRVSRLPETARALLEAIAVAGEPLPVFVLADACKMTSVERERSLSILQITHLAHTVRKHETERWLDVYHDKVRETVLAHLPARRSRDLHRELARALELWPRAQASSMARHYLAAGDTRRSVEHLVDAAQRAVHTLAIDRAAELFRAAGDLMEELSHPDAPDRELDTMRCRAWIGLVRTARDQDVIDRSLSLLELSNRLALQHGLTAELADIHTLRGNLLFATAEVHDSLREYRTAHEHAHAASTPIGEAHAAYGLGHVYLVLGDIPASRQYSDRCIALSQEHDLLAVELGMRPTRALARHFQSDFDGALADCRAALNTALSQQVQRVVLIARCALGFLLLEHGELDESRQHLYEAIDVAHRLNINGFELALWSFIGKHMALDGRANDGVAIIEHSLKASSHVSMRFCGPIAFGAIALLTDDDNTRTDALARGETMLDQQGLGLGRLVFYRDAIDAMYRKQDASGMAHYITRFKAYADIDLPWSRFVVDRAQALLDYLHDPTRADYRTALAHVRDQAMDSGRKIAAQALDQALSAR